MRRLLIISYDAVGDDEFDRLLRWPNFAALCEGAAITRGAKSVYITNTYPVHTSVVTGVTPRHHGLVNNTDPFPHKKPKWNFEACHIKAKTLWQAAAEKGLAVATVMWPVTGGAKEIRYNIPEIMVRPGESQVAQNFKYGSKLIQARLFLRHRGLLRGISQPARDYFAAACMADILREKRPALALMHLTAYDSLCHEHGRGSEALLPAYEALDHNLGLLLAAAGGDYDILLFSDHAQLPAENPLLPNRLLLRHGYIQADDAGNYLPGPCFFECSGGSAFLHPGPLTEQQVQALRGQVAGLEGFGRFLTGQELAESGRAQLPFGFAARPGWACEAQPSDEKANHGYPVDYPHYNVFYLAKGQSFAHRTGGSGGSLLDIAPLAAAALGLDMPLPAPPV